MSPDNATASPPTRRVIGWDVSDRDAETCFMEGVMAGDGTLTITSVLWGEDAEKAILAHTANARDAG